MERGQAKLQKKTNKKPPKTSIENVRKVGREGWETGDEKGGSGRGLSEDVGAQGYSVGEGKCLEKQP